MNSVMTSHKVKLYLKDGHHFRLSEIKTTSHSECSSPEVTPRKSSRGSPSQAPPRPHEQEETARCVDARYPLLWSGLEG